MHTRPTPSPDLRWLHDAWERLTHTLPLPATEGLRAAEAFVDGVVPRGREAAAVVWLLAWRMMPRPKTPPFASDFWIHTATSEVYCYFDGQGYGQRRVLQLLERWARWLHSTHRLSAESLHDLLGDIDYQRANAGFARKRAAQPRPVDAGSVDLLLRPRFPDASERRWTAVSLRAVLAFLHEVQGRPGRLHALDPEAFALDLRAILQSEAGDAIAPGAPSRVLGSAATAYRELAGSEHLPAPVACALADRLERLALGCREL